MRKRSHFISTIAVLLAISLAGCLQTNADDAPAAPKAEAAKALPADLLMPSTTKGYLSIPDINEFKARSSGTQLGQMTEDPLLKDFAAELSGHLKVKIGQTEARIGITLEDLKGIYNGEVAFASIQPKPGSHAMVLLADVSGNERDAAILLFKIAKNVVGKGGAKSLLRISGRTVTKLDIPHLKGRSIYNLVEGNWLIASDSTTEIAAVLRRLDAGGDDSSLAKLPAYSTSMSKAKASVADDDWQARFFVEPFGYVSIVKALSPKRSRKGKADISLVLQNQGFGAVKGVAGYVTLADGVHDFVHRTFVYVPQGGEALKKAARMLDFPNTKEMAPQDWVPQKLSNYVTFNWKVQEGFEYSRTLVNEMAGDEKDDIFEDVLESIRTDVKGPKVDIRKEIVANLGERLTFISHYKEPIKEDSERFLLAIELTNVKPVEGAVAKIMASDTNAKPLKVGDINVWEVKPEESGGDVDSIDIDPVFDDPLALPPEEPDDEEEKALPSSAVAVVHGHLMIATHLDIMKDVVTHNGPSLAASEDYIRMDKSLKALGAGPQSMRTFGRIDESYRVNYEMLRKGQMPKAETMLGGIMNKLLGGGKEGRKPEIDGKKMPDFNEVKKYLGASGSFAKAEDDGLLFVGCMLRKLGGEVKAVGPIE